MHDVEDLLKVIHEREVEYGRCDRGELHACSEPSLRDSEIARGRTPVKVGLAMLFLIHDVHANMWHAGAGETAVGKHRNARHHLSICDRRAGTIDAVTSPAAAPPATPRNHRCFDCNIMGIAWACSAEDHSSLAREKAAMHEGIAVNDTPADSIPMRSPASQDIA
jgi:hypothetical protein